MLFDSWTGIARVVIVGVPAYALLIVLLRCSGKRTLSKMNAFDLVVTVALGSTLASILTTKDVALVEGVVALALLIALQFTVAWLSARSRAVDQLVKADPVLLLRHGKFIRSAMKKERITESEVMAAVRAAPVGSIDEVEAVVLETQGEISVIPRAARGDASSLLVGVASRTTAGEPDI